MMLSEKITILRKQKGWSQEELAERLEVTRQSVSKWESAGAVPDIPKILQMSELFGVSTDYLLKDDGEAAENAPSPAPAKKEGRTVEKAEAEEYLALSRASAGKIALGVLLCILSPIALLLLIGAHGAGFITAIAEEICILIGLIVLLFIVGTAVILCVFNPSFHHKSTDFFAERHEGNNHSENNNKAYGVDCKNYGRDGKKRNNVTDVTSYEQHKILNVSR